MVCPLRYVLFAASAIIAAVSLWMTWAEEDSINEDYGTGLDGMSYWQVIKEFMTGSYLLKRWRRWRGIPEPAAKGASKLTDKEDIAKDKPQGKAKKDVK